MPDIKHFDPDAALDRVVNLFWQRGADNAAIAEVVSVTGLSRSSLYATFGGKDQLYAAALHRYLERHSRPLFAALAADRRGLPAITDFFHRLVQARCTGEHARWGCLISNAHTSAHTSAGRDLPEVRQALEAHHRDLRAAMRSALEAGSVRDGLDLEAAAKMLTLLAYGVNLRSRAGADPQELLAGVEAALSPLEPPMKEN
ncbi:TetR/AcrR family transcriptional regulator [Nonomuraea sp. NPDC059007]|uniref:TetR/AcrR family transcriptional regulator n=1 Tax=Nonomuraea sp. NPDC059007 TaxID=3346692 RepID=UPI0036A99F44